MSRAFVKEPDDGGPVEGLPERQISDHPNYVTPLGLAQLREKGGELEARRLRLLDDDDALAREQLAFIDRDLRYYAKRLDTAILVDPRRQPRRMVAFGATVVVRLPDGSQRSFTIVGEDEADLKVDRISYVSPLAAALLDARPGATVLWRRPSGNLQLVVETVAYPEE